MTQIYAPGTGPVEKRGWTPTPEHLLTPQAQGVPDDPIKLLPAWTPCAVCGQAAPKPNETNGRVRIDCWAQAPGGLMAKAVSVVPSFMLTRCDDCQALHHRAQAVVDAHPGLSAQVGPELAVERVESVLVALGLLGQALPGADVADRDLGLHLRHLDLAGSSMAWQGRAVAERCNPYPFAHVRMSERRRLRAAYAGLLRERVALTAPPVKVPPPPLEGPGTATVPAEARGCLFCGLGHLVLPAAQVQRLGGRAVVSRSMWTLVVTQTDALGGRPSPARIEGYLCPRCNDAVEEEGSVGPSSLSRALLDALAADDRPAIREKGERLRQEIDLDVRPVGWGALAMCEETVQPNNRPWSHIDLG